MYAHASITGKSIYGDRFADEGFPFNHDKPYLLSMANAGADTNGSQFFITTVVTSWLDSKHVVFGEVVEGFATIDKISASKTGQGDRPVKQVLIKSSGDIKDAPTAEL